VAGTNATPINAANVDVYWSADNGVTWPFHLGTFPNTGSASVTIPNPASITGSGRIKVKGNGNVFFNVNSNAFTVIHNSAIPVTSAIGTTPGIPGDQVTIYPVPATDMLHITVSNAQPMFGSIYNVFGQRVWQGTINEQEDVPVSHWARGIYYLKLVDGASATVVVKEIIVE